MPWKGEARLAEGEDAECTAAKGAWDVGGLNGSRLALAHSKPLTLREVIGDTSEDGQREPLEPRWVRVSVRSAGGSASFSFFTSFSRT